MPHRLADSDHGAGATHHGQNNENMPVPREAQRIAQQILARTGQDVPVAIDYAAEVLAYGDNPQRPVVGAFLQFPKGVRLVSQFDYRKGDYANSSSSLASPIPL